MSSSDREVESTGGTESADAPGNDSAPGAFDGDKSDVPIGGAGAPRPPAPLARPVGVPRLIVAGLVAEFKANRKPLLIQMQG